MIHSTTQWVTCISTQWANLGLCLSDWDSISSASREGATYEKPWKLRSALSLMLVSTGESMGASWVNLGSNWLTSSSHAWRVGGRERRRERRREGGREGGREGERDNEWCVNIHKFWFLVKSYDAKPTITHTPTPPHLPHTHNYMPWAYIHASPWAVLLLG